MSTSAPPLVLVNAIIRLAKARTSAHSTIVKVNQLHAKAPRAGPMTEAERCDLVEELDALYLAAIHAAQQERMAALCCLRTLEELNGSGTGGSSRHARARTAADDDAADAEAMQQRVRFGRVPGDQRSPSRDSAMKAEKAGVSPHPYGHAPGWGASDTGDNASDYQESAAGDGEGEGEGEEDEAAQGKGLPELGEEGEVDDSELVDHEVESNLGASDSGAGSEAAGDEGSEMAIDDDDDDDEQFGGEDDGDASAVGGDEIDGEEGEEGDGGFDDENGDGDDDADEEDESSAMGDEDDN